MSPSTCQCERDVSLTWSLDPACGVPCTYMRINLTWLRRHRQCCCPRGKSLSSRILEDQFSSPRPCPRPWVSSPWQQHWTQVLLRSVGGRLRLVVIILSVNVRLLRQEFLGVATALWLWFADETSPLNRSCSRPTLDTCATRPRRPLLRIKPRLANVSVGR